jgi:hypoxanthine phosphoribosyltransferase
MKVFISWSGERSKKVALALRDWLPCVIHSIEPWMSDRDIPPGVRWFDFITKQLNDADFGIICLTRDNYSNPFILFEAGAIAKTVDKEPRVYPYLIDHTLEEFKSLPAPLIQFQAKKADKDGTRELIQALNNSLDRNQLNDERLRKVFNKWWRDLKKEIPKVIGESDLKNVNDVTPSQIDGFLSIESKFNSHYTFNLYKLNATQKLPDQKKLELNWITFGKGIEHLKETILNATGSEPNIFFGINEAGIMIASFLSYFPKRAPVGIIKTGAIDSTGNREILQFEFPTKEIKFNDNTTIISPIVINDPKCIAIVDSEIKSGRSIKYIIELLEKKYKKVRIIYIVLGGVVGTADWNNLNINSFGWDVDPKYKPDFLAFCIDLPGFNPPGGIR